MTAGIPAPQQHSAMMAVPAPPRHSAMMAGHAGGLIGGCAAAFALLSTAGCAVGPNYHRPDAHLPSQYAATAPSAPDPAAQRPSTPLQEVDLSTWWRAFHDPELESLVQRAIQANPDLIIALDRLQAARTFEIAVLGSELPGVEASAAAGRGTGSDLTRGRASQTLVSADNSSGLQHVNVLAGFETTWELDVFGRYRREIEAARADYRASVAARNAVLISVIADVARAYVDLRGLQMHGSVLRSAIAIQQQSARIARTRYERGITNELDVTLADRELGVLQAQIATVDSQVSAAQYTIATLLGQYPEELVRELAVPAMVPTAPQAVQTGLPLELLRRRPDITEAEQQLAGSTARIGVAIGNLFPRIGISAAVGFQQQGLGLSPAVGQHVWSAGPAALWPLLDFGALDAQVEIADLRTRALLVSYRRTIQEAVREVDTNSASYAAQQQRLARLGDALVASQRAAALANERYERGLTDFLNVVDAQRQEYDIEGQYADAQTALAEQFIALYRSLGGGWENYQELPPAHLPQPAVIAAFHRLLSPGDPLK